MLLKKLSVATKNLFLPSRMVKESLPERGRLQNTAEQLAKPEEHKPIESAYQYKKYLDQVAGRPGTEKRNFFNEKVSGVINLLGTPPLIIEVQRGDFWSNLRKALKTRLFELKKGTLKGTVWEANTQKNLYNNITRNLRSKTKKEHTSNTPSLSETRALEQIMADIAYRFAASGFDIGYLRAEKKTGDFLILKGTEITIAPKDPTKPTDYKKSTEKFSIRYLHGITQKKWNALNSTGKAKYIKLPNNRYVNKDLIPEAAGKTFEAIKPIFRFTIDGDPFYIAANDKATAIAEAKEYTYGDRATTPTQKTEIQNSMKETNPGHAEIKLPAFKTGKSRHGVDRPSIPGVWEYMNKKNEKYYLVEAKDEAEAKNKIKNIKPKIKTDPGDTFSILRAPQPAVNGEIHYDPENKVTTLVSRPFSSSETTKARMHLERRIENEKTFLDAQKEQFKRQLERGLYWAALTKLLKRQVGWGTMAKVATKLREVAKILSRSYAGDKKLYSYNIPTIENYPSTSTDYKKMLKDPTARRNFYQVNRMAIRVLQYIYFSGKPIPPQAAKAIKGTLPEIRPRLSATAPQITEISAPPSSFNLTNQAVAAQVRTLTGISRNSHKHWLILAKNGNNLLAVPITLQDTEAITYRDRHVIFQADTAMKNDKQFKDIIETAKKEKLI